MKIESWQAPGGTGLPAFEEQWLSIDRDRPSRLLIVPALFDEANKLRRFTVEVMRRLDARGIDSALPDLPGCNESLAPLRDQTLAGWREAVEAACAHFKATHCLTIRAGDLLGPDRLQGWSYAATNGNKMLRDMLRARILVSRENGRNEQREELIELGKSKGLVLAGWDLGAHMLRDLHAADAVSNGNRKAIPQSDVGGAGLWLRAEPDENPNQAEALATRIANGLGLNQGEAL